MQWLALLAAATISTLPCLATGVTVVNVSIPSPGATVAAGLGRFSSGPGILQGSLWLPDSASSSAPGKTGMLGAGGWTMRVPWRHATSEIHRNNTAFYSLSTSSILFFAAL